MDVVRRGFILLGLSVFALTLFLPAPSIYAAEFGNIGGKPARPRADNPRSQSIFVHEINPQQVVEDAVELVNYTKSVKTLKVYATDSIISSGGAFGCAQEVDSKKGVGSWIKLAQNEVTLKPGQTQQVTFTITAPERPEVGENNGCIVVQEKNAETQNIGEGSGRVALSFRTAIRVAIWIPGDIKKGLDIVGYAAMPGEGRTFLLKPRVHNSGNVSVDTEISTITSNIVGLEKDITEQTHPILRGATSDWNIPFKPSFWGGWYKSYFTATYDENIANFLGESTNKNLKKLRSQTVYFLVAPHPGALLIELFILAIIGFGLFKFWLFWKRKKKTAEEWEVIIIDSQTDIVTLAEKFGVSWKLMAKVNRLKPPYILRPGDAIRVPAQIANAAALAPTNDMKIITIDKPTDVTAVAKEHGVSWKSIAKINKLAAPYILRPGDMIRVPVKSERKKIGKITNIAKRKPAQRMEPVVVDHHTDIVTFAESYGLEWKELARINKLKAPYILKPGYVVMVPVGSSPVSTVVVPASASAPAATDPTPQPEPTPTQPTPTAPVATLEPTPAPVPAPVPQPIEQAPQVTYAPEPTPISAPAPAPAPEPIMYAPTPQPEPTPTQPTPTVPVTAPELASAPEIPASKPQPRPTEPIVHKPKVVKIQDVRKVAPQSSVGKHGRTHGNNLDDDRPPTTQWPT